MLKKLELIGFKSFADRTAFEFAAGITAVVGPNGSGKSNVVDAVRWVLGEQSAKSLRSGAMADVIFNGSTSRRPHSQAEVSLTFDNSKGILADIAGEVCISRRVFRDGQSDYLINGRVCRLKDVKDLFLGTGAGAGAYSIIEQGRVDALLQASQDDRRAIFEEAAGVSRYRAKKVECLRRLERVAENVSRLQDILHEVEKQLQSVRLQAARALKYQEFSTQLKNLRLALGMRDFRALNDKLTETDASIAELRNQLATCATNSDDFAEKAAQMESELSLAIANLRAMEATVNDTKSRAELLTESIDRDHVLVARLNIDVSGLRNRLQEIERLMDSAKRTAEREEQEYQAAVRQLRIESDTAAKIEQAAKVAEESISAGRAQVESLKNEHLEQLRETARWQNSAIGVKAQIDQLRREKDRITSRSSLAFSSLTALDAESASLRGAEAQLEERLMSAREAVTIERRRCDASRELIAECQTELNQLRSEAAGLDSRIDVLARWNQDNAGINAGVQYVLEQMNQSEYDGFMRWLPDCLRVSTENAPLVDLALGAIGQYFVVPDFAELERWLNNLPAPLPGRVGFLLCDGVPALRAIDDNLVGAVRASSLVQCDRTEIADVTRRLLGDVLIVEDLSTAQRLAGQVPDCRFITRSGEILEPDGTVVVGRQSDEVAIVSRKNEFRELQEKSAAIDERIAVADAELAALEDQVATGESQILVNAREASVLVEQLANLRGRMGRHNDRLNGLRSEVNVSKSELSTLNKDIERDERQWAEFVAKSEATARDANDAHDELIQSEQKIRDQERMHQLHQTKNTAAQVALAEARERLHSQKAKLQQSLRTFADRQADETSLNEQIATIVNRIDECCRSVESAQAQIGEVNLRGDLARQSAELLAAEIASLRSEQTQCNSSLQTSRAEWQRVTDDLHGHELARRDVHNQREALTTRLAEDYQIDLAANLAAEFAPDLGALSPVQAQAEIDELRNKLHRLGSVNLESLDELAAIEQKHEQLQKQFDDLTQARQSLEDSIHKINADSKRLFVETFDRVRVHFQEIFRRLFGGGMADTVMQTPDDPLESAIDIVARPPGKELRSIASMSGGERTMTAVALLLSIFKSKPSPFCILDEVDAALDEANTARLATVLREFANTSQFIVITHAKRTMADADMLYGVTMQESGVSKRVAVRFDEWPDEAKKAA